MMINIKIFTLVHCTLFSHRLYYLAQTKIDKKSLHVPTGKGINPVVPAMIYANTDIDKESIIKDNKGKAGVYR